MRKPVNNQGLDQIGPTRGHAFGITKADKVLAGFRPKRSLAARINQSQSRRKVKITLPSLLQK